MTIYRGIIPSIKMTDVNNNNKITLVFTYDADGVDYYRFSKNIKGEWGMKHSFVRRNGEKIYSDESLKATPLKNDNWALKQINVILHRLWSAPLLLQVEINFDNDKERIFARTGEKSVYKWKYTNNPEKKVLRISTKKPSKMESKKMSAKKSPVKCMTGNIEALGKNFNKLI